MLRRAIRKYFGFSSGETNGVLVLIPLMAVFIFSEPVYRWWFIGNSSCSPETDHERDSITALWNLEKPTPHSAPEVFHFDPNTATTADFIRLGISEKVAERITRYRAKGGQFRTKKAFAKIYGLDSALARQLMPWIIIPVSADAAAAERRGISVHIIPQKVLKKEKFDLNLADSLQLTGIYGIGPRLAARIIKYRNRLGGFVDKNQVGEIYGLDTAIVRELKNRTFISADFKPRLIDLNTADAKMLTTLPYIKFKLANAIAAWRFQHGKFRNTEELKEIVLLDEAVFQKIKPYLTVSEF